MTNLTPAGLDLGNTWANLCINGKFAKIPSRIAFEKPPGAISAKTGQQLKPKAFSLFFEADQSLWFGVDTLGVSAIQKLDMSKYDADHINVLFRGVLYQWATVHKVNLATLGKLNIVCSMPPGLFQEPAKNKLAMTAFRKAFNRNQSHVKIRDGRQTIQIVTQFGGLVREAAAWGQALPRRGEIILVVDLGGGTNDYALFNGSAEPIKVLTDNAGLLHAYGKINSLDPAQVELKILREKGWIPHQLRTYFNEVERRIQLINLRLPQPISRLYLIGGGAALMPATVKSDFTSLAQKVVLKNEYANCEANWRAAGGK